MSEARFEFDLLEVLRGSEHINLYKQTGRVKKVLGPIVEGILPGAVVGGLCRIQHSKEKFIVAEIVGFKERTALMMPLKPIDGLAMGARIELAEENNTVNCGDWMIGQLLDGNGNLIDPEIQKGVELKTDAIRPLRAPPLLPTQRGVITERLGIGVRAIDGPLPVGLGQRLAIMAASGVGKSVLMGMIARQTTADVNVIALIGERGREVTEFLARDLGPEGMKKTVVVAVTSDESAVLKVRGAHVATAIAEHFRDRGLKVLLMMDSVTRYAMALREIGLAAGEPPTTKGYTPSVFAQLPRLLERAGAKKTAGSITGLYTVLVEGNDFDEPIADAVRSIVDGHIILSRELASKNHFPAIDVLNSISRLADAVTDERERELNSMIRAILLTYKNAEDLINIGGYRKGNNAEWDRAIEFNPKVTSYLKQGVREPSNLTESRQRLEDMFRG